MPIDATEAAKAAGVVADFWVALGADDDDALVALCSGQMVALFGAGPGLAERIRFAINVKREQCPFVGMTDTVRVLRDGTLAFSCMPFDFGEVKLVGEDGPELVFMWRVAVGHEGGAWRVLRTLEDPLDIEEWVKLPPEWWASATPRGPVN